ncbi:MAG: DUF58 domain-containing protein [Desulfurococcales archaeon]|nr:DUF58 domain-containing protein [Desulfurococcales archaeon]
MRVSIVSMIIPLIVVLSLLSGLLYAPSPTPYSPWNEGPSGTSLLLSNLSATPTGDLDERLCNSTVVIVLRENMTRHDVNWTQGLLECGSRIVLGDSKGHSLDLLNSLGLLASYTNATILDEVAKYRYRWILETRVSLNSREYVLAVPNVTYTSISPDPDFLAARTSPYAYVDLDGNGYYSVNEPMGSYYVVMGYRVGNGTLILVPSTLYFTNKYMNISDNLEFLQAIANGSKIYIYTGSLGLSSMDRVKGALYKWASSRGSYSWMIALLASAAVTIPWSYGYIDRGRVRRTAFLITFTLALIPYFIEGVRDNNILYLVPVIVPAIIYPFWPVASIGLAASLSLVATGMNPFYIAFYLALLLVASSIYRVEVGQGILGSTTIAVLALQAANLLPVIVYPRIVLGITVASLVYLAIAIVSFITVLRPVIVEEIRAPKEAYLGSPVSIEFKLKAPHDLKYYLAASPVFKKGILAGDKSIHYKFTPSHLGVNRIVLDIYISDLTGFAWKSLGSYTIEVNVLPLTSKMLEKAGTLLAGLGESDLLSQVSMAILIRIEETGEGLIVARGEELERVAEEAGRMGGGGGLSGFLARMVEEYIEATRRAVSRVGTYFGAREYTYGDSIKDIHWKKTLSKLRLVSKEYRGGFEGGGGGPLGGGNLLLITDLECTDNSELDSVLMRTLNILVNISSRNPETPFNLLILTKRYGIILRGASIAVLNLLYKTLREQPIGSLYKYKSVNRYLSAKEIEFLTSEEAPGVAKTISEVFLRDVRGVLEALASNDLLPPLRFSLFHCRASASWASFLIHALINSGYRYTGRLEG